LSAADRLCRFGVRIASTTGYRPALCAIAQTAMPRSNALNTYGGRERPLAL